MKSEVKYDCLCAGVVVADFVCAPVARMPAAGELVPTDKIFLTIGGCASNVAVDLRKLDVKVGVAGRVGTDVFGGFVREELSRSGVDTTHLIPTPGHQTSSTLVVNVKGEDRRFIHAFGANAVFDGSEIDAGLIRSSRILYLGGFFLMSQLSADAVAKMFRIAREAGVLTMLDVVIPNPQNFDAALRTVLPWTDIFLPNHDEATLMAGIADPLSQARHFHALGAGTVVITCGGKGSVMVNAHEQIEANGFQADFVDGTGSGDAFCAGYIAGLLRGRDARTCLEMGSAMGASCVRQPGATTGVFTRAELDEYLSREHLVIRAV